MHNTSLWYLPLRPALGWMTNQLKARTEWECLLFLDNYTCRSTFRIKRFTIMVVYIKWCRSQWYFYTETNTNNTQIYLYKVFIKKNYSRPMHHYCAHKVIFNIVKLHTTVTTYNMLIHRHRVEIFCSTIRSLSCGL